MGTHDIRWFESEQRRDSPDEPMKTLTWCAITPDGRTLTVCDPIDMDYYIWYTSTHSGRTATLEEAKKAAEESAKQVRQKKTISSKPFYFQPESANEYLLLERDEDNPSSLILQESELSRFSISLSTANRLVFWLQDWIALQERNEAL